MYLGDCNLYIQELTYFIYHYKCSVLIKFFISIFLKAYNLGVKENNVKLRTKLVKYIVVQAVSSNDASTTFLMFLKVMDRGGF